MQVLLGSPPSLASPSPPQMVQLLREWLRLGPGRGGMPQSPGPVAGEMTVTALSELTPSCRQHGPSAGHSPPHCPPVISKAGNP